MKVKFRDGDFFTPERISPRREKTPEGYLLCRDVPISSTGTYRYTDTEIGLKGRGGVVAVSRDSDELFRPETMASFEGKPVVVGHDEFADPKNWQRVSVGVVQNVRRRGNDLVADLLLTADRGIDLVESGRLKEVSCGYDAETVQDGPGRGHQVGIVGNHVALVERARVDGCRIGDGHMAVSFKAKLRRLFKDGDEDGLNEVLDRIEVDEDEEVKDEAPTQADPLDEIRASIKSIGDRLTALEARSAEKTADEEPAPEPAPEEEVESDLTEIVPEDEAREVIEDAECLDPGMKRPIGDSSDGRFTRGRLERVMRTAMKAAGATRFGDAATLDGKALSAAFKASVYLARAARNPQAKPLGDSAPRRLSVEEINRKFWGN